MNLPLFLSIFGILVVISALGIAYLRKSEQTASHNIEELAQKLGLTFHKGSLKHEPSLKGTYRGIPIDVQSVVTSSGSSLIYTTTYTVALTGTHIPLDLVVYREGILSKIGKAFCSEDIQLDDPELDKTFIIKGASHHNARLFFARQNIKYCFLEMSREGENFRFENKTLFFELPHRLLEEEAHLQNHLDRIVAYANTINQSSGNQTTQSPLDHTA